MKTGIIFYLDGGESIEQEIHPDSLKENLPVADVYRFAETENEVVNYWWELTALGMHRILCQLAQVDEDSNLLIKERCLRLCG